MILFLHFWNYFFLKERSAFKIYFIYITRLHSILQTSNSVTEYKKQILSETKVLYLKTYVTQSAELPLGNHNARWNINNQTLNFSQHFIQGLQRILPIEILIFTKYKIKIPMHYKNHWHVSTKSHGLFWSNLFQFFS